MTAYRPFLYCRQQRIWTIFICHFTMIYKSSISPPYLNVPRRHCTVQTNRLLMLHLPFYQAFSFPGKEAADMMSGLSRMYARLDCDNSYCRGADPMRACWLIHDLYAVSNDVNESSSAQRILARVMAVHVVKFREFLYNIEVSS